MTSRKSVIDGLQLSEQLELVAEYAERLRKAGLTYLRLGEVVMKIQPPEEVFVTHGSIKDEKVYSDLPPLDDPDTFPGGRVPRFRRPPGNEDDADAVMDED